jgi:hypothetical protein
MKEKRSCDNCASNYRVSSEFPCCRCKRNKYPLHDHWTKYTDIMKERKHDTKLRKGEK